jgi:dTDP-4-amino-4,6-dideoxygalactose transaminase
MHLQPVFRHCDVRGGRVAEALFTDGLCLPSGSRMTASQQERVIGSIREAVAERLSAESRLTGVRS